MAVGNKHLGYKEALNAIEATSPGSKHDFYFGFLEPGLRALPGRGRAPTGPDAAPVPVLRRADHRRGRAPSAAWSSGPAATHPVPVELVAHAPAGRRADERARCGVGDRVLLHRQQEAPLPGHAGRRRRVPLPRRASWPTTTSSASPRASTVRSTRGQALPRAAPDAVGLRPEDAPRRAGHLPEGPRPDPACWPTSSPGVRVLESGVGSGALSMTMLRAGADHHRLRAARGLRRPGPAQRGVLPRRGGAGPLPRRDPRLLRGHRRRPDLRPRRARPARAVAGGAARRARRCAPAGILLAYTPSITQAVAAARGARTAPLRHGRDPRGAPPRLAHRGPGGAARPPHGGPHRLPDPRPPGRALMLERMNALDVRWWCWPSWPPWSAGWRLGLRHPGARRGSAWPPGWSWASGCCPGVLDRMQGAVARPADRRRPGRGAGRRRAGPGRRAGARHRASPRGPGPGRRCGPTGRWARWPAWSGVVRPDLADAARCWPPPRVAGRPHAPTRAWPAAFAENLPTAPDASPDGARRWSAEPASRPSSRTCDPAPDLGATARDQRPVAGHRRPRVARSVVKVEGICVPADPGRHAASWWATGWWSPTPTWWRGSRPPASMRDDGTRLSATVVAFDPERDLALLAVPRPGPPGPGPGDARRSAERGGVFGHPGGGAAAGGALPGRRARSPPPATTSTATTRSAAQVLELAAALAPGDSGSAVVDDRRARWSGWPSRSSTDQPDVAYALADRRAARRAGPAPRPCRVHRELRGLTDRGLSSSSGWTRPWPTGPVRDAAPPPTGSRARG